MKLPVFVHYQSILGTGHAVGNDLELVFFIFLLVWKGKHVRL